MSWGAVIGVVGGYVVNQMGNDAAEDAAGAAADANYAAIQEQRRQYDQTRADMEPWRNAGSEGLQRMLAMLNDPSSIQQSPAYQFRLGQGMQALDRSAAARGNLFSGGHHADVLGYGQAMGSQEFDNQWNRLAGLAGVGQTASNQLAAYGAGMANNIGNALGNIGQARGSMYQQIGQNNANFAAGVGGAINNWYQNQSANNGGGSGWYLGNNPGRG